MGFVGPAAILGDFSVHMLIFSGDVGHYKQYSGRLQKSIGKQCEGLWFLALAVLEVLTGTRLTVFLTFLGPGVSG